MQRISRRAVVGAGLLPPAFGAAGRVFGQTTIVASRPPPALSPTAPPRIRDDQAELLLRMLAEAPTHGLDATDVPNLRAQVRAGDAGARDELRRLCIAYGAAQHGQRVPLNRFDPNWGIKPDPYNAVIDFDFAVAHDRVPAWIAAQPPPFAAYRSLRDALAVYAGLERTGGWPTVPTGPDLAIGARGPRVAALHARLAFEEAALPRLGKGAVFTPALAAAVKRFQARHGIGETGTVGASTLAALNASPADRAAQIAANLERWRWMPRTRPADRVEVNIPDAGLVLYQDDQVADTMLAAPGRPADATPMLVSEIGSVVFNPAWHVPKSIAGKELIPKGAGYLKSHGFSWQPGNTAAPLIQKPGPHNALGRIKFDFPNGYGVYLHDTPGHAVFSRTARDVSHGCVRLQRPEELAARLLSEAPDWPAERIDAVLATTDTTRARLPQPMPVMLLYWTAFVTGPQVAFRGDIYGWDAELMRLLGNEPAEKPQQKPVAPGTA